MAIASHFYHKSVRVYTAVFGTLFNGMTVVRNNGAIVDVPIAYGSKERWYSSYHQ